VSGKRELLPPSASEIEEALFEALDDNRIGEMNHAEFLYLPEVANVELAEEEMNEIWAALDPEDTDIVEKVTFRGWFNSNSDLSDRVKMDTNGALWQLGAVYKDKKRKKGGLRAMQSMLQSTAMMASSMLSGDAAQKDDHVPRIIYKEDIEAAARATGAVEALEQEDAWREGRTVLGELDREDMVGHTVVVQGVGKGRIVEAMKKHFMIQFEVGTVVSKKFVATEGGPPAKLKLPSKKVDFTVLDEVFVKDYIEQKVNKAISRWAQKESKIRRVTEVGRRFLLPVPFPACAAAVGDWNE
jgi:hypothetical protein